RIFLAGADAIKIKKHVRLPYLDFTTIEKREATLERELELNRPAAPDIYLGLKRITRESGGQLVFDGKGETVDIVLHMRRFAQEDLLSHAAADGRIDRTMAKAIADVLIASHEAVPIVKSSGEIEQFEKIIANIVAACSACDDPLISAHRAEFAPLA